MRAGEPRPVPQARDCRITQVMAPLLAGNVQATLLAALSGAAQDQQDTLTTLRTAARAGAIRVRGGWNMERLREEWEHCTHSPG